MPELTIDLTAPEGPRGSPLIVFGHSLGSGPAVWEEVVPNLSDRYRVSMFTLPGHMGLPVPPNSFTIQDLGDALLNRVANITQERVFYAGVSISGVLALDIARRYPSRLRGVVPVAGAARLGDPSQWVDRAALVRAKTTSVLVEQSADRWFAPRTTQQNPGLSERILAILVDTPAEGYARCVEALAAFDASAQLGDIEVPLLAIGGELDTIAPPYQQDQIALGVRNGRRAVIPGAAHQVTVDQPAEVARLLLDFFSSRP